MRSASMSGGENPPRTPFCKRVLQWYRPVRTEYRVGVQTEEEVCASPKIMPSFAMRSIFGVGIFDSGFRAETSPKPWSSARMKTMFGFSWEKTAKVENRIERARKWKRNMGIFLVIAKLGETKDPSPQRIRVNTKPVEQCRAYGITLLGLAEIDQFVPILICTSSNWSGTTSDAARKVNVLERRSQLMEVILFRFNFFSFSFSFSF